MEVKIRKKSENFYCCVGECLSPSTESQPDDARARLSIISASVEHLICRGRFFNVVRSQVGRSESIILSTAGNIRNFLPGGESTLPSRRRQKEGFSRVGPKDFPWTRYIRTWQKYAIWFSCHEFESAKD